MVRHIALLGLLLVLSLINWSIYQKEMHLSEGRIVYLKLAPVDPRSLMQGDYMALRFELANQVYDALPKSENEKRWRHDVAASDGYVLVSLNAQNIATFKNIYDKQNLTNDELLLRYRVRNGEVKFATNAYFFQEGHAKIYDSARYGQFRVDHDGELLLVALHDQNLLELKAEEQLNS